MLRIILKDKDEGFSTKRLPGVLKLQIIRLITCNHEGTRTEATLNASDFKSTINYSAGSHATNKRDHNTRNLKSISLKYLGCHDSY